MSQDGHLLRSGKFQLLNITTADTPRFQRGHRRVGARSNQLGDENAHVLIKKEADE